MKWKRNAFGAKLWRYFALFAAIIFAALWLLQTVFLQSFYNGMVIRNVEAVAEQIAAQQDDTELGRYLDSLASENSLLIFLTDRRGAILYSTDEHSHAYAGADKTRQTDDQHGGSGELLGWQIGAKRNLSLPQEYGVFLQRLEESGDGTVGYPVDNGSAYVYGMTLGDAALYISTPLGAVGATVAILRTQLIWITAASLLLAFIIAYFIARRFARPVAVLSAQAGHMAQGELARGFEKGFCAELDELADTLEQTAATLARTENFRREFLANISHDLRTPLTMIRGYAEMVRDISWEDEKQRETDLTVIIREANRLSGLVGDILDYTALQAGTRENAFEAIDLSAAAREVLAQFEPLCARGSCRIDACVEPGLTVCGDRRQLARVLYNLIDNAISHAGENKAVQVTVKAAGAGVRAEVRDFGAGISPEDLPHIWERYFTLKQQKRNEQGSGLGLAISKEILKAHGAEFGAESEWGQGSIFWFELKSIKG